MFRNNPWLAILMLGGAGTRCAGAVETPVAPLPAKEFSHYDIILERKPFGAEVIPPAPPPPKLPPEQSFTAKFKMAAVTRDDNGVIRVGLVDLKSMRSFMLGIGDSVEGVEVVEANYITERARLRRDPEDYWVSMSGGSNSFELVTATAAPAPAAPATAPEVTAPEPGPIPSLTHTPAAGRSSYALRREARLRKELERIQAIEALKAKEAKTTDANTVASLRSKGKSDGEAKAASQSETAKAILKFLNNPDNTDMSQEEMNKLLQEYQKELIRNGQTPLPIPLTPETDQQLVNEGYLPAQ